MANIIITYECNQNCSFCFAEKHNSDLAYNLEILKNQFPFIDSFGEKSLNLIGGEPTLNPAFIDILNWLIEKDYKINVFTNGTIKSSVLKKIKVLYLENIRFYVNRSEINEKQEVFDFYRSLGYLIHLSVTVFDVNQNLSHIIEEINCFSLPKEYRLGIALPIYKSRHNNCVNPADYPVISKKLIGFIKEGLQFGIKPNFDCGFPFCFFDEKQKQYLMQNNILFSSNCGIIPDINAANQMVPCFPLNEFKFSFADTDNWCIKEKEIKESIKKEIRKPIFEKCETCDEVLSGNCNGGCLALQLHNN